MKTFKYTQSIETGYATYVEAENIEQAQEMIDNGEYCEEDFFEDGEPMVVRNLLQEIDEDGEILDDDEW